MLIELSRMYSTDQAAGTGAYNRLVSTRYTLFVKPIALYQSDWTGTNYGGYAQPIRVAGQHDRRR